MVFVFFPILNHCINECLYREYSVGLNTHFVSLEKVSVLDHLEQDLRLGGNVSNHRQC